MRKTSFILILTMLLTLVPVTVSTAETTNGSTPEREILDVLKYLNIYEEYEGQTPLYDKPVTRAEMAVLVGNMLKINEYAKNDKRYYTDVPMDHWALNSINTLADAGVFSVSENRLFRPDDYVTSDELLKVLVEVSGYGGMANAKGGYPEGYKDVAFSMGIIKNSALTVQPTLSQMLTLIFNTLNADAIELTEIRGDSFHYEIEPGKTIMENLFDIRVIEGIVTMADGVSINRESKKEKGIVEIDGEIYYCSNVNMRDYLGRYVEAYCLYDKKYDDSEIVLVFENEKKTDVTEFKAKDFVSFDSDVGILTYCTGENNKSKSIRISRAVKVILNGEDMSQNISGIFEKLDKGTVTLIDADSNNEIETVIIQAYRNITAGYIDTSNEKIYASTNTTEPVDISEKRYIKVIDETGEEKDLSAIAVGNVLSVFESENFLDIYISDKSVNGKMSELFDNDPLVVKIGNDSYEVDSEFVDKKYNFLQNNLANTAEFKLDYFGMIADVTNVQSDAMTYAYIAGVGTDDMSDELNLKLFTQEGVMTRIVCDSKMSIDGRAYKTTEEVKEALKISNSTIEGQLIRYQVSSDNKIIKIDTSYTSPSEDRSNALVYVSAGGHYFNSSNMFGPGILVNSATKYFRVPQDVKTAQDEDYSIVTISAYRHDNGYTLAAYKTDENSFFANVVVQKTNDVLSNDVYDMILVDEIVNKVNKDGEVAKYLTGFSGANQVEYEVSEKCSIYKNGKRGTNNQETTVLMAGTTIGDIKCGDIIRIAQDNKGRIVQIVRAYSTINEENPLWGANTVKWNYNYLRVSYGKPVEMYDNVLKIECDTEKYSELVNLNGIGIAVYDESQKTKVYAGSIGDINDAINTGAKIFVARRSGVIMSVVLIKE